MAQHINLTLNRFNSVATTCLHASPGLKTFKYTMSTAPYFRATIFKIQVRVGILRLAEFYPATIRHLKIKNSIKDCLIPILETIFINHQDTIDNNKIRKLII